MNNRKCILSFGIVISLILIFSGYSMAADSNLSSISLSGGVTLDPAFDPSVTQYDVIIEGETSSIDVTAKAEDQTTTDGDPVAEVMINGNTNNTYEYTETVNLQTGDNEVTIKVTEDGITKEYNITITKITFKSFMNGIVEGRPITDHDYMIEKVNNREFDVRPQALKTGSESTTSSYMTFVFSSIEEAPSNATTIELENTSGGVSLTDIADNITYNRDTDNHKKVTITVPFQAGGYDLTNDDYEGDTLQLRINGNQFTTINIEPEYRQPTIESELIDHSDIDLGILNSQNVYYVPPDSVDGDYGNIIANALPVDTTTIKYRTDLMAHPKTYASKVGLQLDNQPRQTVNFSDPLAAGENTDLWGIDITEDVEDELSSLESNGNLNFRVVRVIAWRDGAKEYTTHTYYFVRDANDPPTIKVRSVDQGGYGDSFDTYRSRRPQLKAKIKDSIAGIESTDDIIVKYRRLQADETKNDLDNEEFKNANQMNILDLESRLASRKDNSLEQVVTFVPYNELGEGEYAVKITAKDKAGNMSDNDDIKSGNQPGLFYLEIDQTGPRINNVSVNNRTIDTQTLEAQPVSSDRLNMYFELYGAEDLIYGIKYLDGDNSKWWVKKSAEVGYVTKYLRTYFNGKYDKVDGENIYTQDGIYEIFIIADEEGLTKDKVGQLYDENNNGTGDLSEISSSWSEISDSELINDAFDSTSYIGKLINEDVKDKRRTYAHFKIEVDGTPPVYNENSLKYYDNYPATDTFEALVDEPTEPVEINQGQPVLEAVLENSSEIKREDIEIYFENNRTGRKVSGVLIMPPEVTNRQHTIRFQPVVSISQGEYNLSIKATDIFGNTTDTDTTTEKEDPKVFTKTFKITTNNTGEFDFSIEDGDRLNINQSSALRIGITNDSLEPSNSLKILVNGAVIVEQGQLIKDKDAEIDSGNRYKEDTKYLDGDGDGTLYHQDDDETPYYQEENYDEKGFDVLFFGSEKRRIVIFARQPLPSGRNKVTVEVVDNNGVRISDSVEFMVDNYRHGFGFGRLLIEEGGAN
ncbi:hypothetical protein JCM16358_13090 [Halanaerocella petrolearia]